MTDRRYFKPRSVTWWASLLPIVIGVVIASEPLHEWAALAASLRDMTGGAEPYVLINAGLVGIGLRGAV